ncbi:MAG: putative efflux transporter, RND family, MFP subunit, partial [Gammaproteobacteria bacterium]|nr:putative efflux transporter, RND family, MFP subunit [Gammaproteobacteria bacterium]
MVTSSKQLRILITTAIALCWFASADSPAADGESAQPAPALTVNVAVAESRSWPQLLTANGVIEPWQEAIVSAQVAGQRIEEVLVEVGDAVTAGQLLARMDQSVLLIEIAELEAAVARAEASLAQANADAVRARELEKKAALSAQDILKYQTQADMARAELNSAQARLRARRLQLERTEIKAPDAGLITERMATLGEVPSLGQALFRMIRQGRLEWRGELTAPQVVRIVSGQTITLRLPDGSEAAAVIRKVAPALRSESRMAIIYADIKPGSSSRAGMYVEGTIQLPATDALLVPAVSVVIRDGRSYV